MRFNQGATLGYARKNAPRIWLSRLPAPSRRSNKTPSYTCNVARGRILTYDLLDNVHPVYHERISYIPSCYVPPVGFEPTTCGLKVRSSDQTELKGLNTQPGTGV